MLEFQIKKNILISCPGIFDRTVFLPYIWGALKTCCDADERLHDSFHWLEPIYRPSQIDKFIISTGHDSVDVLGLSSYIWNFDLNIKLAKFLKSKNPKLLVVMGGPHPNWDSMKLFFEQHPFIDLVVSHEGEHSFKEILNKFLDNTKDYSQIRGVYTHEKFLPEVQHRVDLNTKSPYLHCSEEYQKIITDIRATDGEVHALFETDRGCPYGCSFCNWGSSTMSKVGQIPLERLYDEIEWIGKNKIVGLEIINANFGIFERDLLIAKKICEVRNNTGYPKSVWYSSAKNNPENILEIVKLFKEYDLIDFQVLALQSTDERVLRNIKRANLSFEKMKNFIFECKKINVSIKPQLIRGLQGETEISWLKTLTDVLQIGDIDALHVFQWEILPNSPSDKNTFRQQWNIKTINRHAHVPRRNRKTALPSSSLTEIVYSTSTYSEKEYIKMWELSSIVEIFFAFGFGKYVGAYLKNVCEIPYEQQITNIYKFFNNKENIEIYNWFSEVREHYRKYIDPMTSSGDVFFERELSEIGDYPSLLTDLEILSFRLGFHFSKWWDSFSNFIYSTYFKNDEIEDILKFQRFLIIDYSYDFSQGRFEQFKYDWISYFKLWKIDPDASTKSRLIEKKISYSINQNMTGNRSQYKLDWHQQTTYQQSIIRYLEAVTGSVYTMASRNLFKMENIIEI
jgi:putative methyltransferase